jgi:hypothetical protein
VLAWIVVGSAPWKQNGGEVFDKLQLRSAIADIFSSMGMEGEAMWRAAARVRVLLSQSGAVVAGRGEAVADCVHTEAFWADPDVQWLAGVNKASGVTYFGKEGFEALVSWLQVPALIDIARRGAGAGTAIGEVEAAVTKECRVAQESGYKLETYLAAWRSKGGKVPDEKRDVVAPKAPNASAASVIDLPEMDVEVDARRK